MKRIVYIVSGSLVTLFILGLIGTYFWIDLSVKRNIGTAKESYPGTAEDALIAYLLDTTNSAQHRSSVAVWTLGQIKSEKALPILNELYKNDPKGKICSGKHDSVLCQYQINKALNAIKSDWELLHSRLNK